MLGHASFTTNPMRKLIIAFIALVFALQLQAQDTILLKQILAVNNKITSFEADVKYTMVRPKKTTTMDGKLYFVKPNEFAAMFTTGKYIVVNEKKMKIDMGMFHGTYKLKEGKMMQGLTHIFLYGFQGRLQELAKEGKYTISTKTEDDLHIVTEESTKKKLFGIGYKKMVFKYDTKSLLIREIVLYDYKGNEDTYILSNLKCGIPVDKKTFQF